MKHEINTRLCTLVLPAIVAAFALLLGCNKSNISPQTINVSASGMLSRYDLQYSDYDILPVTTFVASYDQANHITNLFEKSGQSLLSYSLTYSGNQLIRSVANNLRVQKLTYNAAGKPALINYTTLTDTGKLMFTYDSSGKLTALLDSLKQPAQLPVVYQYLYTYDAGGNNVVKIVKNQLDLQNRPTLRQYSLYTFDTSVNPFVNFPYLENSAKLPGDVPALVNKNNVVQTQIVGTILNTSNPGSVPSLDTITTYRSTRSYSYNSQGLPIKATEAFNDIQNNYSGTRTFTYDY